MALLLVAAAVPHMLGDRRDRNYARADFASAESGPLALADAETTFRDTEVRGRLVRVIGPGAPLPPGVTRLPGPGELVVSPALAQLLDSPDGALLRPRLPGRVIGTIGHAGLQGPSELVFYRGVGDIPAPWRYVTRFGSVAQPPGLDPVLLLLAGVALAALLMPVAVFIATAARFGGEARDRRLAALRLVGADRATTVRVAAGESALGGLLGVIAGAALFLGDPPARRARHVVGHQRLSRGHRAEPAARAADRPRRAADGDRRDRARAAQRRGRAARRHARLAAARAPRRLAAGPGRAGARAADAGPPGRRGARGGSPSCCC